MPGSPQTSIHTFRPPARVYLTLAAFFALSLPGLVFAGHEFWQSGALQLTFTLASAVVILGVGLFLVMLAPLEIQLTESLVVIRHLTYRTTVPVELIELVEVHALKPRSRYLPRSYRLILRVRGRSRPVVLVESHFACAPGELTRSMRELVGSDKYVE